eukprot:3602300-Rhodomonas_salina.1
MTDSKCHRCAQKKLEINSHVQPPLGPVCLIRIKKRGGEYDDHSVFCKQGFQWASMDDCLHMMQLTKQRLESTLAQNIKELEAGLQLWIGWKLLFKKAITLEADSSTEE